MKRNVHLWAAFALALTYSSVSFAEGNQSTVLSKQIDRFVSDHAIEFIDHNLTDAQIVQLKLIAHQVAVASTCEEFELDEEKFIAAFDTMAHAKEAGMNEEEKQYFERHLLVSYGVMIGGALATAALDPSGYCENAETELAEAEPGDENVWRSAE